MSTAIVAFPGSPRLAFEQPLRTLIANDPGEVHGLLADVDRAAADGHHCVGFVSYEAAPAFDRAFVVRHTHDRRLPLAWFGIFDSPSALPPLPAPPSPVSWEPDVSRPDFHFAMAAIHDAIGGGAVYQVNYTFRLHAPQKDPLALFQKLDGCALIHTPDWAIVSASPELFFARDGNRIVMRPMKGTARRGCSLEEDEFLSAQLRTSEKERAENLMIVDLVRNDLGRIAEFGTVKVTSLCDVERWPTVLQMTSTVEARVRPGTGTFQIFQALFPCASVTGAPKIAAMHHIARLESSPRGVYCGAIGHVAPGGRATFNVAIRTATLVGGHAEYGVGGGITWDSTPDAEYDEAMTKARILTTDPDADFELIETMRLDEGRYIRIERHLERLRRSAACFGWTDPTDAAQYALRDFARPGRHRVRLAVGARGGSLRLDIAPFPTAEALTATLSHRPVNSNDRFLYHKTSRRILGTLELLTNERGELTEFTIGNLVLELRGGRYTPPVTAGLLPGVFRAQLLERGEIVERTLHPDDLLLASGVWLINSLREWTPVTVEGC